MTLGIGQPAPDLPVRCKRHRPVACRAAPAVAVGHRDLAPASSGGRWVQGPPWASPLHRFQSLATGAGRSHRRRRHHHHLRRRPIPARPVVCSSFAGEAARPPKLPPKLLYRLVQLGTPSRVKSITQQCPFRLADRTASENGQGVHTRAHGW